MGSSTVAKTPEAVDKRGIPLKSVYPDSPSVPVLYGCMQGVFLGLGVGIAYGMYSLGNTAKFDSKIATLAAGGLGWMYCSAFALRMGLVGVSTLLGCERKAAKVNVPDQQVYKVHGQDQMGYVLMEGEGQLGRFNRAQRAYMNLLEQLPMALVQFMLAGFVFPFQSFCMAAVFSCCRVLAAVGYISSPDARMAGNLLGSLTVAAMEGCVLLAGVKAIMQE